MELLRPALIIPVGTLAIEQVLGEAKPLVEVVGRTLRGRYHAVEADIVCLPHPSGASTWHRTEPGKHLLGKALRLLARHAEIRRVFGQRNRRFAGDR